MVLLIINSSSLDIATLSDYYGKIFNAFWHHHTNSVAYLNFHNMANKT